MGKQDLWSICQPTPQATEVKFLRGTSLFLAGLCESLASIEKNGDEVERKSYNSKLDDINWDHKVGSVIPGPAARTVGLLAQSLLMSGCACDTEGFRTKATSGSGHFIFESPKISLRSLHSRQGETCRPPGCCVPLLFLRAHLVLCHWTLYLRGPWTDHSTTLCSLHKPGARSNRKGESLF